ncbi:DUF4260 domain-containing protein [Lysinibacillus sp. Bpr_S20]|uniref:DUF4260 domain-containing protein n=1 Tax=Lysinibacillus sp. Bpr_S20 TaxID=2933964 RepID=UPI00201333DF|nr:DUF4260 domain-containing protein [Lysinibacillus sp. Bpr_S20]MCL1699356.1 DUF4260 domain-containing protein [Lysinibacillus sp. Bpr_S20]
MKLRKIISLEYLIAFLVTVFFYWHFEFSFLYFVLLLLLPDITMLGYIIYTKVGAIFYNIGHSLVLPAILLMIGFVTVSSPLLMASIIWLAHIFLDRTLGYGLKYDVAFTKTHLQQIA